MGILRRIACAGMALALLSAPLAVADQGSAVPKRIPPSARSRIKKVLNAVIESIPKPDSPYEFLPEQSSVKFGDRGLWDATVRGWWKPASVTAERYYEVPSDAAGLSEKRRNLLGPIELSVEINGELKIGDLGSEGGALKLFPIKDATAVEISTIGPGEDGGRVAAQSPEEGEYRLTALTVIVGDEILEQGVRNTVEGRKTLDCALKLTADPSEVRYIYLRLHGPKKPIEDLAKGISTASLRRLLHH